ncbi:hypothetical protein APS14_13045 [Pseudomonas thivervalensis]|nr:hypothetical protein APS14_13045 [Pseudomonas thivervalensis]
MLVAFERRRQHLMNPIGEIRVQTVINPLALPTIRKQTARAQLRQVPGDFGLALVQRAGQFANTKLPFPSDEQHGADTGFISQAFENSGGCQMVSHIDSQRLVFTRTNILMCS